MTGKHWLLADFSYLRTSDAAIMLKQDSHAATNMD